MPGNNTDSLGQKAHSSSDSLLIANSGEAQENTEALPWLFLPTSPCSY